jgi:hypothetical protein
MPAAISPTPMGTPPAASPAGDENHQRDENDASGVQF